MSDLDDRSTRCIACGHERLWHVQPGVATTDCSAFVGTDDCSCPAFEPPVPEPYDGPRLVTADPPHLVTAEWLAEVTAERDDWRRRYEALRDGVTWLCDESEPVDKRWGTVTTPRVVSDVLRALVARVEGAES